MREAAALTGAFRAQVVHLRVSRRQGVGSGQQALRRLEVARAKVSQGFGNACCGTGGDSLEVLRHDFSSVPEKLSAYYYNRCLIQTLDTNKRFLAASRDIQFSATRCQKRL